MSIRMQASTSTGAVIVGWALALAACGGGSSKSYPDAGNGPPGTGGTGGAGPVGGTGGAVVATGTPTQQCNQLAMVICTRAAQCPGLMPPPVAVCQNEFSVQFSCDLATAGDFTSCVADTNLLSCASLFNGGVSLPGACDDPIGNIPLSDAQKKCYGLVDAICGRDFQCQGVTPNASDLQNCEASAPIDCLLATGVGASYAACLAGVPTWACDTSSADGGTVGGDGGMTSMMPLHPECTGVITLAP